MNGIPGDLLFSLRNTLADCEEFKDESQLEAVFLHELLEPWRKRLPRAKSVQGLVDAVITTFRDERRADTHANVLVLLLIVLRDRYDRMNALHGRIGDLAEELGKVLPAHPFTVRSRTFDEANPENQQMLFTAEWLALLQCIQAIGKINVPQIRYGETTQQFPSGTGWLIAPGLALTCWHVMKARSPLNGRLYDADLEVQAKNSVLTFDYLFPGKGIEHRIEGIECYDATLDYALLSLEDRVDDRLSDRGFLRLEIEVPLTVQTNLYIIQHPKGQPQQYSSGRFIRYKPEQPERILHSAPTEAGTSGAPVINVTNWRVIALHNSENEDLHLREATLLKEILSNIQQKRPDLHSRIMNAY